MIKSERVRVNLQTYLRPEHLVGPSRFTFQSELKKILPTLISDEDAILDFGCGNGNNRFYFTGFKLYGFDIDKQKVALANENGNYFVTDAVETGIKGEAVDFIFCNWVLEYVPNFKRALNEMYRILKPGGRVYLGIPTNLEKIVNEGGALPVRFIKGIKNLMLPEGGEEIYFSRSDVYKIMGKIGFKNIEIKRTAGLMISMLKIVMIYLHFCRLACTRLLVEAPLSILKKKFKLPHLDKKASLWSVRMKGKRYPSIDKGALKNTQTLEKYLNTINASPRSCMSEIYVVVLKILEKIDDLLPMFSFEIAVLAEKGGHREHTACQRQKY